MTIIVATTCTNSFLAFAQFLSFVYIQRRDRRYEEYQFQGEPDPYDHGYPYPPGFHLKDD